MANTDKYWDSPSEHSQIKSSILVEYFYAWATIMKEHSDTLTYLDLFSGRGTYKDGQPSTPLLLLSKAMEISGIRDKLCVRLYEGKRNLFRALQEAIDKHPARTWLKNEIKPKYLKIDKNKITTIPVDNFTLSFIDPYGYKGISLELLEKVVSGWGNDCLFFYSSSGIRRNVGRSDQKDIITDIIGENQLTELADKQKESKLNANDTISALRKRLSSTTPKTYFLPFQVNFEKKKLDSHFLVFITKDSLAFHIMKSVMAKYSLAEDGIPSYIYNKIRFDAPELDLPYKGQMQQLEESILRDYSGQTIKVESIRKSYDYRGLLYIPRNICDAVLNLESKEKVIVKRTPKAKNRVTEGCTVAIKGNK